MEYRGYHHDMQLNRIDPYPSMRVTGIQHPNHDHCFEFNEDCALENGILSSELCQRLLPHYAELSKRLKKLTIVNLIDLWSSVVSGCVSVMLSTTHFAQTRHDNSECDHDDRTLVPRATPSRNSAEMIAIMPSREFETTGRSVFRTLLNLILNDDPKTFPSTLRIGNLPEPFIDLSHMHIKVILLNLFRIKSYFSIQTTIFPSFSGAQ
jgi:hypothetical protein